MYGSSLSLFQPTYLPIDILIATRLDLEPYCSPLLESSLLRSCLRLSTVLHYYPPSSPFLNMTSPNDMKPLDKSDTKSVVINGENDIYIDPAKEKKILRKFDMLALPQFIIIMILAYLDRTNIGRSPSIRTQHARTQLTRPSRQRPRLRLRSRPQPPRERVRQPLLAILRHLRSLRTPLGARGAEIRREPSARDCNRRLERRDDRHRVLP